MVHQRHANRFLALKTETNVPIHQQLISIWNIWVQANHLCVWPFADEFAVQYSPTILNGCSSLSFFCCASAKLCNFAKMGLGSTKKSRKYDIDVPAIFGNFWASLPRPSRQTISNGMWSITIFWPSTEFSFWFNRPHSLSASGKLCKWYEWVSRREQLHNGYSKVSFNWSLVRISSSEHSKRMEADCSDIGRTLLVGRMPCRMDSDEMKTKCQTQNWFCHLIRTNKLNRVATTKRYNHRPLWKRTIEKIGIRMKVKVDSLMCVHWFRVMSFLSISCSVEHSSSPSSVRNENVCHWEPLPVSSPMAQTSKSTHAAFAITLILYLLTEMHPASRRSLSWSCCLFSSSVCPSRNSCLTNSCTSFVNGVGKSTIEIQLVPYALHHRRTAPTLTSLIL